MNEIKKTKYNNLVRVSTLSSRKQLCIHPIVKNIQNTSRQNDVCMEMAKNGSSSTNKKESKRLKNEKSILAHACPYLDKQAQTLFR